MEYVHNENIEKFARFAARVWNEEVDFNSLERTARKGIEDLRKFFRSIGLPTSLGDLDVEIDETDLEEMARKCTDKGPVGNFVKLDEEDVLEIYHLAR